MKVTILPTTKYGKASLMLAVTSYVIVQLVNLILVGLFRQHGGNTLFDNIPLSVGMVFGLSFMVMGGVAGIIGIAVRRERSVLVMIISLLGLAVVAFLIGEASIPH